MQIVLFLHLYQPPTQFPEVLDRIVKESYLPLLDLLDRNPDVHLTVNICAALTEQLSLKHWALLSAFRKLAELRQIELTGSAAYHPLLTRIPDGEVLRQIKINEEKNTQIWRINAQRFRVNDNRAIRGFFAPEMAINAHLLTLVKRVGYLYTLVHESAVASADSRKLAEGRIFQDPASGLKLVIAHKDLSLDVAYSRIRTVNELFSKFKETSSLPYLILAMDGETFGHHRPEQLKFLDDLLNSAAPRVRSYEGLEFISVSELLAASSGVETLSVVESSWAESFDRWQNPANPVQVAQWQLLDLALRMVNSAPETDANFWKARELLDKGLHSDQFWWAAHNPCWHYQMVQRGAMLLTEAVAALSDFPGLTEGQKEAEALFKKICETGLQLYGETTIAC